MKHLLWILVGIVGFTSTLTAQENSRSIENPQIMMIGARQNGLGMTNPVIFGDINGLFINPAVISHIDSMPVSTTYQRLMNDFEYMTLNSSMPLKIPIPKDDSFVLQNASLGLSFGRLALEGIPETIFEDERVRPIGLYASGFHVFEASLGASLYDIFNFHQLSLGAGVKMFNHFLGGKSRNAFGFDLGAIAMYQMNHPWVTNLYLGGSVVNIFATSLVWEDTGNEALLPLQMYFGAGADLFDDLFTGYVNTSPTGFSFSGEFNVTDHFALRGGTDFTKLYFGTGLVFSHITGFGYDDYSVRLDYAYTTNDPPNQSIINHTVSISILGETAPKKPKVLRPEIMERVNTPYYNLKGIGPKRQSVQIYSNGTLKRTAMGSRFGTWRYEGFPLVEGENKIFVKAYEIESDFSPASDEVIIISDTIPPTLNIVTFVDNDLLKFEIEAGEAIKEIQAKLDNKPLTFRRNVLLGRSQDANRFWKASFKVPDNIKDNAFVSKDMSELKITARDIAGNSMEPKTLPFFVGIDFPKDKFVQYKDRIRVLGRASELAKTISIADKDVELDKDDNFAQEVMLEPGKNLVKVQVETKSDQLLNYVMRILSLSSFSDIDGLKERREIEFMTTLGVLFGDKDGKFYPNKKVTRRYMTRIMVDAMKLPLETVEEDVMVDVPTTDPDAAYIQTAIMNGLIFAFPNGTFRPDSPLTLTEVVSMLSSAYVIADQEVEDTGEFLTRKELAMFLAYTPKYEPRIERLIDWESGYFE